MLEVTLFLDDYHWIMSNPITQNRDLLLYKNTLKGPKLEIFVDEFFTQSKPVWVDDLGTRK
jgi:hypothetical protein